MGSQPGGLPLRILARSRAKVELDDSQETQALGNNTK